MQELVWMLRYSGRAARRYLGRLKRDLKGWVKFWKSYRNYKRLSPKGDQPGLPFLFPCLNEDTALTDIDAVYFYQDAWAFEKIVQRNPTFHVDVGSHHKYVALLSKVVPVTMIDIRPLAVPLESLNFKYGTILDLPFANNSLSSISSLCVVEHIGLGRYGDPLDPAGTEKAIRELTRVLATGGRLYLSLPVSTFSQIAFNAHRITGLEQFKVFIQPLEIVSERFIVGNSFQVSFPEETQEPVVGLFELTRK